MSVPSTTEERLLKEFRQRVGDVLKTKEQHQDSFLVRWLRARDLDLIKAEHMLRASILWREQNNIDNILDVQPDTFFIKEFPWNLTGVDKQGNPVVVVPMRKWDARKVSTPEKMDELKRYINYNFEYVCRAIKQCNESRDKSLYPVTQFTAIMDWTGYPYLQLCHLRTIQSVLYAGGTFEAHYPEILCRCICVNCPSFFGILHGMLKRLLAQRTFQKIEVYGSNRAEWEQACREVIDNDQFVAISKHLS